MPQDEKVTEGWGWPGLSKKAHYFTSEGRSLCMRWLFMGALTRNQNTSVKRGPDDCAECHKRLLRLHPPLTLVPPPKDP